MSIYSDLSHTRPAGKIRVDLLNAQRDITDPTINVYTGLRTPYQALFFDMQMPPNYKPAKIDPFGAWRLA